MKRILFSLFLSILSLGAFAQMSDSQIMSFYQREAKAGTSQGQIVTKLMQSGVSIDQIRRVRDQYTNQAKDAANSSSSADASTGSTGNLRKNNGAKRQELTSKRYDSDKRTKKNMRDNQDDESQQDDQTQDRYLKMQRNGDEQVDETLTPGGKKVFGRDIFNNKLLSFEPNMNIATPTNYTIGPGDEVVIEIYGASQKSLTLTVSPEGTVTVPGYGPIYVSGMSVDRANAKIRATLGSRFSSSQIKTSVGQTRTIIVNVMGEVKVPGTYTLSAFASVFHALYMAGGINGLGTLRNIKVFRNGRLATVVDVYDYILNGRLTGNIRLRDNDVIVVGPYDCLVDIGGAVKRPMTYEMRKNESVASVLRYSGGFAGNAYKKSIRLNRASGNEKSVFNINEFDMSNFRIADGDSLGVDSILNRYENMVEVKGAVFRPGMYQLGNDINSVRSLIRHAEGVTEDAFTDHAVLHRMKADRTLEVVSVDITGIMKGTVADIPLKNEDVLFVPTQSNRTSTRSVTIHGEIQFPGTYQYADNETIEDFIMQAGGLTDAASTAKVDVSRRIMDPAATESSREIAQTFSFTLKDGFVIDGKKEFKLQPYDEVYVRRSPGFQIQRNVRIEGEVLFSGSYTLNSKNMRLSELVKAAGGTTRDAYVRGARIERLMNDDERARMQNVLRIANMQNEDSKDSIKTAKLDIGETYYVGIHLEKALANPGSNDDIVLREGDKLVVPEYNGTVKVSGDVMFPNTVAYACDKRYKYYINQAGGFGIRAKKSKAFIVYQNGTVCEVGHGKVEPGCEIIVPSKPKSKGNGLANILGIGTSVASLATMIATISNLVK
ncbi:SLBB domain-containing protein [Prevotella herbatica]|nr:SLBB domain-containing protein [Prevotella herbatica]